MRICATANTSRDALFRHRKNARAAGTHAAKRASNAQRRFARRTTTIEYDACAEKRVRALD
jgi:hypothetical protein